MTEIKPFQDCPRFMSCNVNDCPLDPLYPDTYIDSWDNDKKCTLGKVYRLKIAAHYPGILKMMGMTKKEFASWKAWNEKPPEEQEKHIDALKKNGFGSASQKKKKQFSSR